MLMVYWGVHLGGGASRSTWYVMGCRAQCLRGFQVFGVEDVFVFLECSGRQ